MQRLVVKAEGANVEYRTRFCNLIFKTLSTLFFVNEIFLQFFELDPKTLNYFCVFGNFPLEILHLTFNYERVTFPKCYELLRYVLIQYQCILKSLTKLAVMLEGCKNITSQQHDLYVETFNIVIVTEVVTG